MNSSVYWQNRMFGIGKDLKPVGLYRKSHAYNLWLYRRRLDVLWDLLGSLSGKTILDIGCGNGFYIPFLEARGAIDITGIDISPDAIRLLRDLYPKLEFYRLNIARQPVNGKFDIILVFDVLFHITEDSEFERAMMNIREMAKPETLIVVTGIFPDRPIRTATHCKYRSMDTYKKWLQPISIRSLFYTMQTARSIPAIILWELLTFPARWDRPGDIIGQWLYRLDTWLASKWENGNSGKMVVFKKRTQS